MIIIYRKCPICGKLFKANTHGRPRKYCSKECKIKQKNIKRKERRIITQKCQYCGKTFKANKKKYCSQECYEKAHQDKMNKINTWRWYNDPEYRAKLQFEHGGANGTIKIAKNPTHDWKKEQKILNYLRKKAGLSKH